MPKGTVKLSIEDVLAKIAEQNDLILAKLEGLEERQEERLTAIEERLYEMGGFELPIRS